MDSLTMPSPLRPSAAPVSLPLYLRPQTAGVSAAQASGAILAGTAEAPGAVLKGLAAGGFAFVYALLIVSNLPLARARRLSAHVMVPGPGLLRAGACVPVEIWP